jgi:hypothetical protein
MRLFTLVCSCGHSSVMSRQKLSANPAAVITCRGLLSGTRQQCGRQYQASQLIKIADRTDVYQVDPAHPQLELTQ